MTSTTTALLQHLATLRATRDAIMAEIDAINTAPAAVEPCGACGDDFEAFNCTCAARTSAPAEVEPCGECGNDFAEYNCTCEAPTFEHFDY